MKTAPLIVTAASLALFATSAHAQVVGAGTAIPSDAVDGGGGRINVDTSTPLTLAAGNYTASLFSFDAGIAGDVQPFLAILTGTNVYQAIAVGASQAISGASQDTTTAFGGSANFTLGATTTIYAGIASQSQNPIFLDNDTGPNTDHEGGGEPSHVVTVGGTVPPDGSFSNADLGRTYAYSVTVVPEPTALAATLLGGLALGLRRRRS